MTPTPHFAARRRWTAAAWIAGVWIFLAVLQATQRYLRGRELEPSPWAFWGALADNLVIAALWAAATPVVMRIARRYAFPGTPVDRKSTRLNSSHSQISYAVFCLTKTRPSRQ